MLSNALPRPDARYGDIADARVRRCACGGRCCGAGAGAPCRYAASQRLSWFRLDEGRPPSLVGVPRPCVGSAAAAVLALLYREMSFRAGLGRGCSGWYIAPTYESAEPLRLEPGLVTDPESTSWPLGITCSTPGVGSARLSFRELRKGGDDMEAKLGAFSGDMGASGGDVRVSRRVPTPAARGEAAAAVVAAVADDACDAALMPSSPELLIANVAPLLFAEEVVRASASVELCSGVRCGEKGAARASSRPRAGSNGSSEAGAAVSDGDGETPTASSSRIKCTRRAEGERGLALRPPSSAAAKSRPSARSRRRRDGDADGGPTTLAAADPPTAPLLSREGCESAERDVERPRFEPPPPLRCRIVDVSAATTGVWKLRGPVEGEFATVEVTSDLMDMGLSAVAAPAVVGGVRLMRAMQGLNTLAPLPLSRLDAAAAPPPLLALVATEATLPRRMSSGSAPARVVGALPSASTLRSRPRSRLLPFSRWVDWRKCEGGAGEGPSGGVLTEAPAELEPPRSWPGLHLRGVELVAPYPLPLLPSTLARGVTVGEGVARFGTRSGWAPCGGVCCRGDALGPLIRRASAASCVSAARLSAEPWRPGNFGRVPVVPSWVPTARTW